MSTMLELGKFDPFTLPLSPFAFWRCRSGIRSRSTSLMLLTLTCRSGHAVFEGYVYESTPIRSDYRDAKGQTPCSLAQSTFFPFCLLFPILVWFFPGNSMKMAYWLSA